MLFEYYKNKDLTTMNLADIYQVDTRIYKTADILDQNLSVRVKNACKRNHIDTVADLLDQTPASLMQMRSFGKNCLDEIEEFMGALENVLFTTPEGEKVEISPEAQKSGYLASIEDETCREMVLKAMEGYYATSLQAIIECVKNKENAGTKYLSIVTKIPTQQLAVFMEILEERKIVTSWSTTASRYYNYTGKDLAYSVTENGAIEAMDW